MTYDRKWEIVDYYTSRMETPEGWLVQSKSMGAVVATTYVPDFHHEWKLTEIKK